MFKYIAIATIVRYSKIYYVLYDFYKQTFKIADHNTLTSEEARLISNVVLSKGQIISVLTQYNLVYSKEDETSALYNTDGKKPINTLYIDDIEISIYEYIIFNERYYKLKLRGVVEQVFSSSIKQLTIEHNSKTYNGIIIHKEGFNDLAKRGSLTVYNIYGTDIRKTPYFTDNFNIREYNDDKHLNKKLETLKHKAAILGIKFNTIEYITVNNSKILTYSNLNNITYDYFDKLGYTYSLNLMAKLSYEKYDGKIKLTQSQLDSLRYNIVASHSTKYLRDVKLLIEDGLLEITNG